MPYGYDDFKWAMMTPAQQEGIARDARMKEGSGDWLYDQNMAAGYGPMMDAGYYGQGTGLQDSIDTAFGHGPAQKAAFNQQRQQLLNAISQGMRQQQGPPQQAPQIQPQQQLPEAAPVQAKPAPAPAPAPQPAAPRVKQGKKVAMDDGEQEGQYAQISSPAQNQMMLLNQYLQGLPGLYV